MRSVKVFFATKFFIFDIFLAGVPIFNVKKTRGHEKKRFFEGACMRKISTGEGYWLVHSEITVTKTYAWTTPFGILENRSGVWCHRIERELLIFKHVPTLSSTEQIHAKWWLSSSRDEIAWNLHGSLENRRESDNSLCFAP